MQNQTRRAILTGALSLLATPALARESNYNPRAGGNGNGNGANNANCNSALILSCEGEATISGAPGPAVGVLGVAGTALAVWAARRRR